MGAKLETKGSRLTHGSCFFSKKKNIMDFIDLTEVIEEAAKAKTTTFESGVNVLRSDNGMVNRGIAHGGV